MRSLNVLVACEESQRVCMAFRELGHAAYSCDIQEPSGGHPEWHIFGDVLPFLNGGFFLTMDNVAHEVDKWDLIIAHPPCTYLSNVASRSHSLKSTPIEKINSRTIKRIDAMRFFMEFVDAECEHIAIENPVGVMNTCYRKPDQIINPYQFADSINDTENYVTKATCLWLKNLPLLVGSGLPKPDNVAMYGRNPNGKVSNWEEHQANSKDRSKTFSGIAKAIANQYSDYILSGCSNNFWCAETNCTSYSSGEKCKSCNCCDLVQGILYGFPEDSENG